MFALRGGGSPSVVSWRIGSPDPPRPSTKARCGASPPPLTGEVVAVTTDLPGGGVGVRAFSAPASQSVRCAARGAWTGSPSTWPTPPTDGCSLWSRAAQQIDRRRPTSPRSTCRTARAGRCVRVATFPPDEFVWGRFNEDGAGVGVWTGTDATYLDLARGRQTALDLSTYERTPYDFLVGPTGVLTTRSDGAFTRYDASGQPAQVLEAHTAPVSTSRSHPTAGPPSLWPGTARRSCGTSLPAPASGPSGSHWWATRATCTRWKPRRTERRPRRSPRTAW